jgi:trigger factor
MNITKEETGELTATIKIELGEEDYKESVDKQIKERQKGSVMPGFRPGKVPAGMIRKMYGKSIIADEVNKLLSENVTKYLVDNKINVIGTPLPSKDKPAKMDIENDTEFEFYFDIGVAPEFDLDFDDSVAVDYYKVKPDKKMIEEQIKTICIRMGDHSHPEEAGEEDMLQGHLAELDEEGNEKEGGIQNTTAISLKTFVNDSQKKEFLGASKDDTIRFNPLKATENETETAYMLGISKEELGDTVPDFNFTVSEITRQEPAEMNEELFKKAFGEDCTTEEDFRNRVEESISKSIEPESDNLFMNDAIEALIEKAGIDLPHDFMKRIIYENNEGKLAMEEIEKQYDDYAKSFKWQLIESKLAKEKEIRVEEEEIRNVVKGYFMSQGLVPPGDEEGDQRMNSIVDSVLQNEDEGKKIHDQLFTNKVKDELKSSLKLNEKEISYEDFVKMINEKNKSNDNE